MLLKMYQKSKKLFLAECNLSTLINYSTNMCWTSYVRTIVCCFTIGWPMCFVWVIALSSHFRFLLQSLLRPPNTSRLTFPRVWLMSCQMCEPKTHFKNSTPLVLLKALRYPNCCLFLFLSPCPIRVRHYPGWFLHNHWTSPQTARDLSQIWP